MSGGLAELLADRRVCICAGAGGVGKTTTSAAIALGMAARGRRVAVVTIDPAQRLANALGLVELDNEPRRVDLAPLATSTGAAGAGAGSGTGSGSGTGELWAMMLDPKRTFDELIERVAPDPERAREIKRNRIYRELSGAVSGSQEFTAVAKLFDLARARDFDLLVLDTPPSRNALDFLEAPGRLTAFLEGSTIRTLLRPTGLGMRVLGRGASPLLAALRRITGVDLLGDLATFFGLLGSMTEDFATRAAEVERLLHDETTAFLLVTAAAAPAIEEAIWFRRTLAAGGLPFAGVVVNRVHHDRLGDAEPQDVAAALHDGLGDDLARRVAATFADYHRLARRDHRNLARLTAELHEPGGTPVPLIQVPQLDGDVHDLAGLDRIGAFLFADDAERARLIDATVA